MRHDIDNAAPRAIAPKTHRDRPKAVTVAMWGLTFLEALYLTVTLTSFVKLNTDVAVRMAQRNV